MNDDANVPVLNDLIYRGRLNQQADAKTTPPDADGDLEIDNEDAMSIDNDPTLKAEQIRTILSKHMDSAYLEIMQLLEQKNEQ